jgi:hypothetical protein
MRAPSGDYQFDCRSCGGAWTVPAKRPRAVAVPADSAADRGTPPFGHPRLLGDGSVSYLVGAAGEVVEVRVPARFSWPTLFYATHPMDGVFVLSADGGADAIVMRRPDDRRKWTLPWLVATLVRRVHASADLPVAGHRRCSAALAPPPTWSPGDDLVDPAWEEDDEEAEADDGVAAWLRRQFGGIDLDVDAEEEADEDDDD